MNLYKKNSISLRLSVCERLAQSIYLREQRRPTHKENTLKIPSWKPYLAKMPFKVTSFGLIFPSVHVLKSPARGTTSIERILMVFSEISTKLFRYVPHRLLANFWNNDSDCFQIPQGHVKSSNGSSGSNKNREVSNFISVIGRGYYNHFIKLSQDVIQKDKRTNLLQK